LLLVKIEALREDVRLQDKPRDFKIAQQFKEVSERNGVAPENAGEDVTGGGKPFIPSCKRSGRWP